MQSRAVGGRKKYRSVQAEGRCASLVGWHKMGTSRMWVEYVAGLPPIANQPVKSVPGSSKRCQGCKPAVCCYLESKQPGEKSSKQALHQVGERYSIAQSISQVRCWSLRVNHLGALRRRCALLSLVACKYCLVTGLQ